MITLLELAYRTISQPLPPQPAGAVKEEAKQPEMTRDDVDAILQVKRTATPEQLQTIIDAARRYKLSTWEGDTLGVQLGIALAQKARGKLDRNAQFIYDVLDYADTSFGMLANRSFYEREYRRGAEAISRCRNHHPPRCQCWGAQRHLFACSECMRRRESGSVRCGEALVGAG